MCWAKDRAEAIETAHRIWPNTEVPGQLSQDLPTPAHFEQASSKVTPEQIADAVACGPDPEPVLSSIEEMVAAGVDHVYLHQIGPDQEGFLQLLGRGTRAPRCPARARRQEDPRSHREAHSLMVEAGPG